MAARRSASAPPAQTRKRIEDLENQVSVLTGALESMVDRLQSSGVLPSDASAPPKLSAFLRHTRNRGLPVSAERKKLRESRDDIKANAAKSVREPAFDGLHAARLRGEAARLDWVRTGEVVPAKTLADRWGLTPQALGPAAARGEVFALLIRRQRYFPREFLELDREAVAIVCKALKPLSASEQLVFWKRPHGALGGKTVFEVLGSQAGASQVQRVAELAAARAAQASAAAGA